MSQLAKEILKKAKEEKASFVDLGNCGLDGYLPDELFDEYFIEYLEGLSLGNVTKNYLGAKMNDMWVKFSYTTIEYYKTLNNGAKNNFYNGKNLEKISCLKRLSLLMIANEYNIKGDLESMSFVEGCTSLNELDIVNNQINKIEGLNENLKELRLGGNKIAKIETLTQNLQILDLGLNQIIRIENLNEGLQMLNLSFNKISKIEGLNNNLENLYLGNNQINKIEGLNEKLKAFYISFNSIKKIEGLNENLKIFDIRNNQISELDGLGNLKDLQSFYISENKISKLNGLENLKALQTFDISNNKISVLIGLENLKKLQTFYISANRIYELKGLRHLKALQTLDISNNQVFAINGLENLKALQTLNLSNNKISLLEGLDDLEALKKLEISKNKITELNGLEGLIALKSLNVSNNLITGLMGLQKLVNLEELDISHNEILKPNWLENFTVLQNFYNCRKNVIGLKWLKDLTILQNFSMYIDKIAELKRLDNITALQKKEIIKSQVSELAGIEFLKNLHKLNLSSNQIQNISQLLPFLQRIENPLEIVMKKEDYMLDYEINIDSNPLTIPPVEIVQKGNQAILNWFKAREQGSIINHEAKCILFGNGKSGKTTLSHQLRKNEFLEEYNITHGILIKKWIIPKKNFPSDLTKKISDSIDEYKSQRPDNLPLEFPESLQLNIWDFGGQEYYHATHRLFLSSNVLYLLLWDEKDNSQNEDDLGNLIFPDKYWQKNINHFSPKNITLKVQNKVNGQSERTDRSLLFKIEMRDKQNDRSIKRYDLDIEDLKEGIYNQLINLDYIGKPFPKVYNDIRQALQKEEGAFMIFDDYQKFCRKTDQTTDKIMQDESHIKTLTQFLHDTGVIVCYRYDENVQYEILKKYVFIKPQWLTEVIYSILEKKKKELNKVHVELIASKYGLETELWINLMKEFELIFEIKRNDQTIYIAPQYLNKEYNQEAFEMLEKATDWQHTFTFHYPSFLPPANFLRLIAKYGSQSTKFLYWKEGLVFTTDKITVYAKCNYNHSGGNIAIYIQLKDKILAKELFESLLKIDESYDLEITVNKKDFVNVKKLKERIHHKDIEIESTSGNNLKVEEFGFLFGVKKNEGNFKNDMDKKEIKIFVSYSSRDREICKNLVEGLNRHVTEREGLNYSLWTDNEIDLGTNWKEEIEKALKSSNAALLLVSAGFASSKFIKKKELTEFFKRMKEDGYLILPVLIRTYNFQEEFEELSSIQFFKTYYSEYDFNAPALKHKLMPFDVLFEGKEISDRQFENYYSKLADHIHKSVRNHFKIDKLIKPSF